MVGRSRQELGWAKLKRGWAKLKRGWAKPQPVQASVELVPAEQVVVPNSKETAKPCWPACGSVASEPVPAFLPDARQEHHEAALWD